jgi:hypothetical protein
MTCSGSTERRPDRPGAPVYPLGTQRARVPQDGFRQHGEGPGEIALNAPCHQYGALLFLSLGSASFWRVSISGRRDRRLGMTKRHTAPVGESAHQPVRLDRVPKPRFGPAVRYTGLNGARRHLAAVGIEQRQLAARLRQASLQVTALRLRRPHGRRRPSALIVSWILTTHEQDRSIMRLTAIRLPGFRRQVNFSHGRFQPLNGHRSRRRCRRRRDARHFTPVMVLSAGSAVGKLVP